jgi:2-polyprenyl-6-methoxyphenol hydroxylase-like FAD-dependent oxidoreductase
MLHELLLHALKERLGEGPVFTDHVFTSYSQDEEGITANFRRKLKPELPPVIESKTVDVLVGADGINSTARPLSQGRATQFLGKTTLAWCISSGAFLDGSFDGLGWSCGPEIYCLSCWT